MKKCEKITNRLLSKRTFLAADADTDSDSDTVSEELKSGSCGYISSTDSFSAFHRVRFFFLRFVLVFCEKPPRGREHGNKNCCKNVEKKLHEIGSAAATANKFTFAAPGPGKPVGPARSYHPPITTPLPATHHLTPNCY